MIKLTLEIARCCPLVIQGFSNFLGLFQVIVANPDKYTLFQQGGLNLFIHSVGKIDDTVFFLAPSCPLKNSWKTKKILHFWNGPFSEANC